MLKQWFLVLTLAMTTSLGCAPAEQQDPDVNVISNELYKPSLYLELGDAYPNPDGMTIQEDTNMIFLNIPNFNAEDISGEKEYPAVLATIDPEGNFEEVLQYPVLESTGQVGPMGLDFGPDGHLYVADNQYFHDSDHKSRVLRVLMEDGKPTGEVESVIEGMKLANALLWLDDKMYVTDTFLDLENKWGSGGVWAFDMEELQGDAPLQLKPNGEDEHLIVIAEVNQVGREDKAGADGLCADSEGNLYFGNFGDGVMFKVTFDEEGNPLLSEFFNDERFTCCDGIFFDPERQKIFINDSQANSIRTLTLEADHEVLWENGDTDGSDGLLDQPCECVVRDDKLIIVNFDIPFPGLKNTEHDKPYTLSVINLEVEEDHTGHDHADHDHDHDHEGHDHGDHNHGDHDHEGHDHGDHNHGE